MYKIIYLIFIFIFCIISIGEFSKLGDSSRRMQKSQSVQHIDPPLPIAPSLYKYSAARQKSLKNMFKDGSIKETMRRLISKFFIYESVPPQKTDLHHFKNTIFSAQQVGLSNCIICFNNDISILNYDCKFATPYQFCFNHICKDGHRTTICIQNQKQVLGN